MVCHALHMLLCMDCYSFFLTYDVSELMSTFAQIFNDVLFVEDKS